MPAEVLLDQVVFVAYGQIYLESATARMAGEMAESFRGQSNGLCGGVVPGMLFLITGTHTGEVRFRVELHDREPPLGEDWEDAVEASLSSAEGEIALAEWGGSGWHPLRMPAGDYRVRYHAQRMDEGHQGSEDRAVDHYLLQLWPASPAPDRIVRVTSAGAAYWHRWAQALPPPPTPAEVAEAARRQRLAQQAREVEQRAAKDRRRWGDRAPNDRLRQVKGSVRGMERVDLPLVFDLSETDDETLRAVARWAVEQAYRAAGLTDLPWVAPALTALREGQPPPPPFHDLNAVWPRLDTVPLTTVRSYDGRHDRISQQHAAVPAYFGALEPDALQAALDALFAAVVTYGSDYPRLLAEVRTTFACRPHD
jgi:hypothetical protein